MSIVTGCRGLCLKFEGEVRLIHGIGGNPFVYADKFRNVEIGLPQEMVELLDLIIKRQGGYYDPDHERWVSV